MTIKSTIHDHQLSKNADDFLSTTDLSMEFDHNVLDIQEKYKKS